MTRLLTRWVLLFALVLTASANAQATPPAPPPGPPVSAVLNELCVHAGWHYTSIRQAGRSPDYVLWGHGYWHTYDVPDYVAGGSGEGGWTATSNPSYGGGLSFMVGTWNRAAGLSHGVVPYVSSTYGIAGQPPRVQLLAMWLIVQQDHGGYGEWPQTSVACGI